MQADYTLLLLVQHYPFFQHVHFLSKNDIIIEDDIAEFLRTTEQQISKRALDNVYAYASAQ